MVKRLRDVYERLELLDAGWDTSCARADPRASVEQLEDREGAIAYTSELRELVGFGACFARAGEK
jgi:hypothetical protein